MNLSKSNVVLAVLAAVLAIPTTMQLSADAETFVDVGAIPTMFDGFSSDNVGLISLAVPAKDQPKSDPNQPNAQPKVAYDKIELRRVDKGWVVHSGSLVNAPVMKERVESDVFQHLRLIRADKDAMVQPNATPEQLAEFGLDDKQAFVIQCRDQSGQAVVADLLVGRDAGIGQSGTDAVRGVFVRKSDSSDVVLYEFDKGWRRDVATDGWLDKVLAKLEPEKIRKVSLRNTASGGTFTFERGPGKASWQMIAGPGGVGAVRQIEVENLVQRLRWLAVQDYRVPVQSTNLGQLGLANPAIELEVVVKDGDRDRVLKLGVGNKLADKNEYYVVCNESAFVMTWSAGMVTPFEIDAKATLFDPASPDQKNGDDKAPAKDEKKGG
ncbi:MAG: DUF4340 domain-containing protein [Planctomycetes bacterium]|nr:DUF4340 domain-containing protein [Planctomycetota bacterium]